MEHEDFQYIQQFIHQQVGISIDSDKQYLVVARLTPLLKEFELETFGQLSEQLRLTSRPEIHSRVIDALTINETFFFRDIHPFEALKKIILPQIIEKRRETKTLNIWCGAASSGQEPYSIAMLLMDLIPDLDHWKIQFIASDISVSMLKRAEEGMYNQFEINRGLPLPYLAKYFKKSGDHWQIKDEVRKLVQFKRINLVDPWFLPSMDIIFLRNVLIYFEEDIKKLILQKMEKTLDDEGFFFLGSSETLLGLLHQFERVDISKVNCFKLNKKG